MRQYGEPKRSISPSQAGPTLPPNATVGQRLRYLRRRLGRTIAQFATAAGVSHNVIARLERDETRITEP